MAGMKEIRTHIKSVEETLKITNAMYLIASSNVRRAKKQLIHVGPYFHKIESTIADILYHSPEIEHRFFDQRRQIPPDRRKVGYVIITSDKGMAGAYNHNILKLAEQEIARVSNPVLLVVGQVGRAYFAGRGVPVDEEFLQTDENPTMWRARDLSEDLIMRFDRGELDEIYVLYTNLKSSFCLEPTVRKLLPLSRDVFPAPQHGKDEPKVTYLPSVEAVMNLLVAGYLRGELLGTLTESYCSEQNARMTAMKSSSDNAREMLQELNLSLNRARQAAITQEINEVVGGAQAAR